MFRHGLEFNNPLLVRKVSRHPGTLPKRWGLLEVSHPSIVLSALKPGAQRSVILRMYEATGRPATGVAIRLGTEVAQAEEVNLMEDPIRKLEVGGGNLSLEFRSFEIKTVRLTLRQTSP